MLKQIAEILKELHIWIIYDEKPHKARITSLSTFERTSTVMGRGEEPWQVLIEIDLKDGTWRSKFCDLDSIFYSEDACLDYILVHSKTKTKEKQ